MPVWCLWRRLSCLAKGHLHHTWYILKGSFVVLQFSHGLPEGAPFNIFFYLLFFCENSMSTGTLGQLKLLFCLLRKVRKRKQTAGESWGYTLTDLFIHLGEKHRRGSAVSLHGSGLNEAVAALQDLFQTAQQRFSVGWGSLWMWKSWFSHLHGNHILLTLFPHPEMRGLCLSLLFILGWCHSCFGLRLLRATKSTEVTPKRPWRSIYSFGDKEPFPNPQGSFIYCLLELAQPLNWGHWAP